MIETSRAEEAFSKFRPCGISTEIIAQVERLLAEHLEEYDRLEVYRNLYGCIDYTSLRGGDTEESVAKMVMRINDLEGSHPNCPNVAGICVYPALLATVRDTLTAQEVRLISVCGGFPASQTFAEVKIAETALAVAEGAEEIDVVLNLNRFLSGDYEACAEELEEIKESCRGAKLKVIIESGLLADADAIRRASILALFSGADFIKTSTGKEYPGASLEAVFVMCQVLKEYYEKFGQRRGLKVSGGVRTPEDALKFYCIVAQVLGDEWLTPELFRIGTSSLEGVLREKC